MFAHLVQARLGAAARIATTAILALLLLVAGWTPARVLPTLAVAGAAQATGTLAHQDAATIAWGARATAIEAGTPDGSLDATAPAHQRQANAPCAAIETSQRPVSRGTRQASRHRPRAPPTTV